MAKTCLRSILSLLFFLVVIPMTVTHCTSSEDETVLDEELENLDSEGAEDLMSGDIDDLSDLAEDDLESLGDEAGAGEEMALDDDAEFEEIDLDKGDANFAEVDDESSSGKELGDDEFAEFDESEFNEFDEGAKGEEELAKEMQGGDQEYPVAKNAQPQFPEEVMSSEKQSLDPFMGQPGENPPPGNVPPLGSPIPGPGQPLITSETTAITVPDEALEPQMPQDDLGMADPIVPADVDEAEEKPSWVPVVKIKTDAFYRNKRLLNAVYIARPDDNFDSISDKIFKEDRTDELKADNDHLLKGIDPGDKVYYNSPNRPEDTTQLKVYYEDIGLAPQYYKTKKDDNMRRLGSKLLGFSDGWKEIWAINQNVDSKTILPTGVELKYWTGHEASPSLQAATTEAIMPETKPQEGSLDPGFDEPIGDMGDVELPPEPIPNTQIAMPEPVADPEIPDIEPFPEEGVEATPGPPPVAVTSQKQDESLLTVGALALLLMAGAGLVAIQIKKRKDQTGLSPQSLEYTQV